MFGDDCSDSLTVDFCPTPTSGIGWIGASSSRSGSSGLPFPHASDSMFLWAGSKAADGRTDRRSIYQRIREYEVLDRSKTVTALRAGEDRALLLGLSMVLFSVMMYFVLGITILRSYSDSVWTSRVNCTVVNATVAWDVNCSYSCGAECRKSSRYPCLIIYVSVGAAGRVVRLLHDEDAYEDNAECFFIPKCRKDYASTLAMVQTVSERLRAQPGLQCFVDPGEKLDSSILTQVYGRAAVVRSLLWPTCSLVGGTLIIAMVKLTQYLSVMCERPSRVKAPEAFSKR